MRNVLAVEELGARVIVAGDAIHDVLPRGQEPRLVQDAHDAAPGTVDLGRVQESSQE